MSHLAQRDLLFLIQSNQGTDAAWKIEAWMPHHGESEYCRGDFVNLLKYNRIGGAILKYRHGSVNSSAPVF